jgi:light-regulated signal transduction histidine kinase (bacteriophytochrome)
LEWVESGPVLDQCLKTMATTINDSSAQVASGDLPSVWADSGQLSQLFQNLVGNAIKYRSERPVEIVVKAVREGAFWHFSVADNGIGIESQHYERIFGVFQRLHTREEYPGTGIGLAICKKIVERHGGMIWVTSVFGEGSVFHFTLPATSPRSRI